MRVSPLELFRFSPCLVYNHNFHPNLFHKQKSRGVMVSGLHTELTPVAKIARSILVLRGQKVLLDAELAALYGVSTRRLNEQVRRNRGRFPADFVFELTTREFANLKSHFATSSWGGRRKLPLAFTEHGAIQVATILNSPLAVEMSVYVVRAFLKLRKLLVSNQDLSRKLAELEISVMALDLKTQQQFKEVYDAIRALMGSPTSGRERTSPAADVGREQ